MSTTISTTAVAQQPVEPATIIATPGAASLPASPNATVLRRTIAYAESWYDEPSILLPDRLHELEADLPVAIAEAKVAPGSFSAGHEEPSASSWSKLRALT